MATKDKEVKRLSSLSKGLSRLFEEKMKMGIKMLGARLRNGVDRLLLKISRNSPKGDEPEMHEVSSVRWSAVGRKPTGHVVDLRGKGWRAWGFLNDDSNFDVKKGQAPGESAHDIRHYLGDVGNVVLWFEKGRLVPTSERSKYLKFETRATLNGDTYFVRADIEKLTDKRQFARIASWDMTPAIEQLVPFPSITIREVEVMLPGAILEVVDLPLKWNL